MNKRISVFLIDDDYDDQKFFHMAAKRIHGAVYCEFADDGLKALKKLSGSKFKPEIIFIDINMPLMNGIECLQEIKKLKRLEGVPLYMYSTSADPQIISSCIALGATGVVKKLPNVQFLSERLWEIFSELNVKRYNLKTDFSSSRNMLK